MRDVSLDASNHLNTCLSPTAPLLPSIQKVANWLALEVYRYFLRKYLEPRGRSKLTSGTFLGMIASLP